MLLLPCRCCLFASPSSAPELRRLSRRQQRCCVPTGACRARAELMRAKPDGALTVDELVRQVRPRGRAAVPDAVKAELLAALRAAIA